MPEGPEIRRAADQLAAAVAGRVLTQVWFGLPQLKAAEAALTGCRVVSITSRGKALLTQFDEGSTLYSHNQLYGVWRVVPAGTRPDTARSLRVALETAERAILLYSASDIQLWRTAELDRHPFLAALGPDVLDPALAAATVAERLASARFRGRGLPALLLDQSFLAGMGNYLRSEVLHEAQIAPMQRPRDLDPDALARLARALLDVPRRSYRTRGRRASRAVADDPVTDTPDRFRMHVFGRDGQRCARCGDTVVRTTAAGRRLYWSPGCQH